MPSVSSVLALGISIFVAGGLVIGLSILGLQQQQQQRTLIQLGNFTWDLSLAGAVSDSLRVNYQLYESVSHYTLELDALPRPLRVPGELSELRVGQNVQVRMHRFEPRVTPLDSWGYWEYIIPLSQRNIAAMVISGPRPCLLSGWASGSLMGRNAIGLALENDVAGDNTYEGYAHFFLQLEDGSEQDWSNYSYATTRPLQLTLFSA